MATVVEVVTVISVPAACLACVGHCGESPRAAGPRSLFCPTVTEWGFLLCCTFFAYKFRVVSAALSERKVAGSIPTIGDFHTVGPCKKAVFACLATDVK